MKTTTRRPRGFTLLEVLAALAILGIMTSLSVVSYRELIVKRRESNAIREIYAAALEARQRARVSQQPVRVVSHAVLVDGRPARAVRWERPACAPGFEPTCPMDACRANVCGENGCACDERGLDIAVPPTLDVEALSGLCFLGGSARPRGLSCDAATPAVERVQFRVPHRNETQALLVEPLTGLARLEQ
ncbi:prepilin-type N-terminal cleavage/methylation domain-containing protein [Myxococcus sp. K15C18031901]|uniref:pilus assembly FimT family protein n=1 Tax=Myxococcus dinghuensis TaxID=2906761 RepID=UPI0020A82AC6|nr:prepilin-type N-terminal cleavage/methylation domain-containing protein [Myxococcus dinghuensis]MCP3102471.1 prepilin-type N-terminal cleavage/methylation domain-containing protein [Myxococcus dinghuensis]